MVSEIITTPDSLWFICIIVAFSDGPEEGRK